MRTSVAYAEAIQPILAPDPWRHCTLELEPGRFLVGNAGVLAGTVGVIKHVPSGALVQLDVSTNHLPRAVSPGYRYTAVVADRVGGHALSQVRLVSSHAYPDVLAAEASLPEVSEGDVVVFLEAGMYADSISNQVNAVPRPATILVFEGGAELIRRRETVPQVFSQHLLSPRFRAVADESLDYDFGEPAQGSTDKVSANANTAVT